MSPLLTLDLAGMLEFGGFIHPDYQDNPEMMCKIGYLTDLINMHTERPPERGETPSGSSGTGPSVSQASGGVLEEAA